MTVHLLNQCDMKQLTVPEAMHEIFMEIYIKEGRIKRIHLQFLPSLKTEGGCRASKDVPE